jgi:large subunit ribosomal protein L24
MKLHKGDTVIVIAGKDRGKTGSIEAIMPSLNRVVVAGLNAYKKHVKPTPKNPQGGIITAYRSMDASNVMLLDPETKKPTRVGYTLTGTTKSRMSHLTKKAIGSTQ